MAKHSGFELVGDITPDADNTRNLGSSTNRFANVYAVSIHSDSVDGVDLSAHVADENAHHNEVHGLGDTAIHTGSLVDGQHGDRSAETGVTHHDVSQINGAVSETTFNSHASRHEHGGADEIDVTGLSGRLLDAQPFNVKTSATSEEKVDRIGGSNCIDVSVYFDADLGGKTAIVELKKHASRHQNGGDDEINVNGLSGLLADPQKFKVDNTTATNITVGAGLSTAWSGSDVTLSVASALQNFVVPLYGMTPEFTEGATNVYDPYRLAFQFRPSFDCKWAGVRICLRYVGSPPQLNLTLRRWNGTTWVTVDDMAITTADCGSNASAGYATFVTKLIDLASREKLNAGDLYEIRIASTGDGSNYWRLYYDSVSYRDWKGKDCIGYKYSSNSGASWTDYEGRELACQVLVSPDV